MGTEGLCEGLYDLLVTQPLARKIEAKGCLEQVLMEQPSDERLRDYLVENFRRQLSGLLAASDSKGPEGKTRAQLALVNDLLKRARELASADAADVVDLVGAGPEPKVLKAIYSGSSVPEPPVTGLAFPWLFTAGRDSPALLAELRRELASCDQVDILVSFVKNQGVRKLEDVFRALTAINAAGKTRAKVRLLTTTYLGATEQGALDFLARLPGCEVRVSLDGRRSRLHAKAWIFSRKTGFGTAYIGSANLTGAALAGGLEWTLKFTQRGQVDVYERARAQFESLWSDGEFQRYNPNDEDHRSKLASALAAEAGGGSSAPLANIGFFDLEPKPFQREMLDEIALERERGRRRNLLVAATGTGKTMVAAFDYRDLCRGTGYPRLLYVAHRKDILSQARSAFRAVLRNHDFGQILIQGARPTSLDHLFASVQSLQVGDLLDRVAADHWHTVYVDECHHMAATGFERVVTTLRPVNLVGLTATPERADGKPLARYFDMRPDGAPAVELRLWDALDLQLLVPFEYYGCNDETDFRRVNWAANPDSQVDRLVTGNDIRARAIIDEWRRLAPNARESKTLAFTVSIAHAEFMSEAFTKAGLPAVCLTSESTAEERSTASARLQNGEVCVLVTVDLFNEGVDLPFVDTLLLLRPTQSPVVFQQQIGRGLRLAKGKESCLVLDFIGQHNTQFRFDKLLGSITSMSRRRVAALSRARIFAAAAGVLDRAGRAGSGPRP